MGKKPREKPNYLLKMVKFRADAMLNYSKSQLYHKKLPEYKKGANLYIIVDYPHIQIIGLAVVDKPIRQTVEEICEFVAFRGGEHHHPQELRQYFLKAGAPEWSRRDKDVRKYGIAIDILEARRFKKPIELDEIIELSGNFYLPLGYRRLDLPISKSLREALKSRDFKESDDF